MRRSRCFVFDNQFEVAKFLWRQNQSVQLRLIMYMSAQPLPIGAFGMGDDIAKVKFLYDNALFFSKNYAKISRIAKNELFMSFSPQQR